VKVAGGGVSADQACDALVCVALVCQRSVAWARILANKIDCSSMALVLAACCEVPGVKASNT
jgi:hypothetical protein